MMYLSQYAQQRVDLLRAEVKKLEDMTPTWRLFRWSRQSERVRVLTEEVKALGKLLEGR
jgi:hypothetical protein